MRSHIGWRGERNILYNGVETSSYHKHFKTTRLTTIHNGPKRIIFGLLQWISDLGTEQCTNEYAEPQRGVPHRLKKETSASENAKPRERVNCEIPSIR